MKILSLKLENFRGIKDLEIHFDGHDADIYGANGVGKTTIANAICWLMLDRPATNERDFDPKTTGTHNLKHSASMTVSLDDGKQKTFSKTFYEVWTRKKGSEAKTFSGHTTDYAIDGVPSRKSAYTAALINVCGVDLDKVKILMLLGYFAQDLSVDERRKILFEVCDGDITDGEVIMQSKLDDLLKYLLIPGTTDQYYSTEEYKKIAAKQRQKLNKDLEMLPERIDEVSKSIPEITETKEELQAALQSLDAEKSAVQAAKIQANKPDQQQQTMQQAIAQLKTNLEKQKADFLQSWSQKNQGIMAEITAKSEAKAKADNESTALQCRILRAENERNTMQYERERLLNEYAAVQAKQWTDDMARCPTCGQDLPVDTVQKMREDFRKRQSEQKEDINRRGEHCSKQKIASLEAQITEAKNKKELVQQRIEALQADIRNLNEKLASQPRFESTPEYLDMMAQIKAYTERMADDMTDKTAQDAKYDEQLQAVNGKMQDVTMRMAKLQAAETSKQRVQELQDQQQEKAAELEYVEAGIYLCDEFTRAKVRMVTEQINGHFHNVRFQLFKDQINGGLKETCDPLVQNKAGEWVEYKSANTASQVNADLEIVDVLNTFYKTSLPVIMDHAESVTQVQPIAEQLIRLIVSADDKELRVDIKED